MQQKEEVIRNEALKLGADVCGIANIERFVDAPDGFKPTDIWKECKSVVVIGIALPKGLTKVEPRLIYGHFNYLTCPEVDRVTLHISKFIEREFSDAYAMPIPCDGPYEYWDADKLEGRGLISMKHAAVLAGLGNLGKNTLLLNKKYGNMLVIGTVLTNIDLKSDELSKSICIESCHLCVDNCPVNAIEGKSVIQKRCRESAYGTTKRGFETVDCNKCREICPMKYGKC